MVDLILKRLYKAKNGRRMSKEILRTKACISILNGGVCITLTDIKLGEKIEKAVKT